MSEDKSFKKFFKKVNPDIEFGEEQLNMGKEVEKEHTTDEDVAETIAKHHLSEDPKYYTKLKKVEKH